MSTEASGMGHRPMKSAKRAGMNYWRCSYCNRTKPTGSAIDHT